MVKMLPDNQINDRWLAQHKLTGQQFEMKIVPRIPEDDPVRELALNELKVLQYCNKCSFCVELIDFFEDDQQSYLVTRYISKTLQDYAISSSKKQVSESKACQILY